MTVAELTSRGAVALDGESLRELIVGKPVRVRNLITNQHFEILYGPSGNRVITALDGDPQEALFMAELAHGGARPYRIVDGTLVTDLRGSSFAVRVFRLGEAYYAARDNEFGYVNYEVTISD